MNRPLVVRLLLLLLPLLGLAYTWTREPESDRTTVPPPARDLDIRVPESYMTRARVTRFQADGHVEYVFEGRRAARQEDTAVTLVIEPRLDYRATAPHWRVVGSFARVPPDLSAIELWDQVRLTARDGSLTVDSSRLWLYPDRRYADTDKPVTITTESGHTDAVGMEAYLDEQRMVLLADVISLHQNRPLAD